MQNARKKNHQISNQANEGKRKKKEANHRHNSLKPLKSFDSNIFVCLRIFVPNIIPITIF